MLLPKVHVLPDGSYNLLGIENKIHDYFTVQQARSELLNLHHELKFFYFRPFSEQTGRVNWNSSGLLSGVL
jgi:hypothetical protein